MIVTCADCCTLTGKQCQRELASLTLRSKLGEERSTKSHRHRGSEYSNERDDDEQLQQGQASPPFSQLSP